VFWIQREQKNNIKLYESKNQTPRVLKAPAAQALQDFLKSF
jgi:hypothetical protein